MQQSAWILGVRGQKILKVVHVICVSCLLGGIVSILTLMLLKQQSKVGQNPFPIDWSVYQLFNTVVYFAFFGIILTALGYALFTKWGFFKHHWITVKWVGSLVLFAVVWFWGAPAITGTIALSDGEFHLTDPDTYLAYSANSRIFIVIAGLIVLGLSVISIYKPWGIRKREWAIHRKIILIVVGLFVVAGIASSILTSRQLQTYRNLPITDPDLSTLQDGDYPGNATIGNFTYQVEVTIHDHTITAIHIVANRTSSYAKFAEGVIPKILKAQKANVDTVTGATTTSKALLKAVENALTKGSWIVQPGTLGYKFKNVNDDLRFGGLLPCLYPTKGKNFISESGIYHIDTTIAKFLIDKIELDMRFEILLEQLNLSIFLE